jgi:Phosphotransferase enzyme family
MRGFEKRRPVAVPGSIPDVLDMFRSEVRFYREIAPIIGVRVPACYRAEDNAEGTLLVLEDLSTWTPGADPIDFATLLADMHARWHGATARWPWLRPVGAAADLVGTLYDEVWPAIAVHPVLSPRVREVGARLLGHAARAESTVNAAVPLTLCHGDASYRNARTRPDGQIALLDWEDVTAAPGVTDLAWLLTSSVPPERWGETITAYGDPDDLDAALPACIVQGLLSLNDIIADGDATADGDGDSAAAWGQRLDAAVSRLQRD